MLYAPNSLYPPEINRGTSHVRQRRFDGRKQICVTEWFEQKPRCSLLEHPSTNRLISLTGDEYDRDLSVRDALAPVKVPVHSCQA